MNEYEKSEFERHKKAAEKQLNQMYYGTGNKSGGKEGIAMPSFLSLPKNPPNNTHPSKSENINNNNKGKNASQNAENKQAAQKPAQHNSVPGKNILNMLNFKGMKIDNDRLIILAVCLLLAGEETDELLMLALIYIML